MSQAKQLLALPWEIAEVANKSAIARDQYWESETTVWIFDDNSRLAGSGDDFWLPTQEQIDKLEYAEKNKSA